MKRLLTLILAVMLVLGTLTAGGAWAASATASISGGGSVEQGKSVTLTVKYTGATFGAVTGEVTYDADVLTYESCTGAEANGGAGKIIFTMSNGSGVDTLSCKLKFKAAKAGKSDVTLTTKDLYNLDLEELTAASKSTSVTVTNTAAEASSNANLTALYVSAGSLSPAFSKDVTAYNIKIDNSVTKLLVTAQKADSKAKVEVIGSADMKVGENTRKVVVTAENGKTKTYVLTITRGAASDTPGTDKPDDQPVTPPAADDPPEVEKPAAIEAVVRSKTYHVCENLDGIALPKGFSVAAAAYNDVQIPVIKDQAGNLVLGLLKHPETLETDWFFYNEDDNEFVLKHGVSSAELFTYADSLEHAGGTAAGSDDHEVPEPAAPNQAIDDTILVLLMALGGTIVLLLLAVIALQVKLMKGRKQ